jgi:ribonuclease P protein component
MLPKKKRLDHTAFNRFFASGKRFQFPLFMVVYSPTEETKMSVVAPKKVFKTAVARNTFRRQVYTLIRPHLTTLASGAYICIAKPGGAHATYSELERAVREMVHKLSTVR